MRRSAAALVVLAIMTTALTGCAVEAAGSASTPSAGTARYRISGSGTCLPLLRILTAAYKDPGVSFVYLPGLHSGGGIQGVAHGDLEIGAVSRNLDATEQALGLRTAWFSNDGLVIAVHPSVQVDSLTTEQVRDIYAGKITNWRQVGGQDMRIHVLDRNEDESAKIILRKFVLGILGSKGAVAVTPAAIKLYYEPDMVEALTSTPGAIGYFSLGYGLSERIPVTFLKLDGIEATVANVLNGRYKVIRPLGVVTEKRTDSKIEQFLQWAQGPQAAAIMKENGYAPAHP